MQKKHKWVVLEKPAVLVPQREKVVFLGTSSRQVQELDKKARGRKDTIEGKVCVNWKTREEGGFGSVHSNMPRPDDPELNSLVKEKILYLCSVGMDTTGTEKEKMWMGRWGGDES